MLVAVLAALTLAACSEASSSAPSASVPPATSPTPTTTPAELVVGGKRPVTVHVPASYDPTRPAPLLILLHGYTADGDNIIDSFGLTSELETYGFVYAAPDGTRDTNDNRFWNATDACCDFQYSGVDDSTYLAGVIAEIRHQLAIDPKRIAVAGHSNGGFMSYRMACEHADLVAAIVSVSGATFDDPADCAPSEPVSVVQVHGTFDDTIGYYGGYSGRHYPGARTSARTWASYDGCDMASSTLETRLDIDARRLDGVDPAETTVDVWSGCDGGASVQLWTIPEARHVPELTPAFAESVVRFLVDHPKP